ncbi:xanthine dehydrogenase family protein subunit M [Streptomyces sp. HNM0574]|uniref:FAD binding domain-containing protein n=1 Tax=Streptomyces sp. HNM0574 TaxID=2714954 RepID=UPI00146ACB40|nr:xanthine dehydrogenase family protein subunit M [Streptomyces sp. HNM0574]NLU71000.1 xanthine dehydrogenase family protein subunit M [Streptomyces sp. HNM0574]
MRPFDYTRATDPAAAVAAVAAQPGAAYLAGGTNLVDHLRLGVAAPAALVDVTRLPLGEVAERPDGGLSIGATVRNSDLAAHPLVRARYPVLSQALLAGASGQLRNAATTGGNLLQRTRCVYFQDTTTACNKRTPGSGCSALGGWTRHHAVLGASEHCVAVHPSDMAVALAALDATVVVLGPEGERRVPLGEFHRLPGDAPERDTVLRHGDLVTAVELPAPRRESGSGYRKIRDRASFAFALVSVAAVLELDGPPGGRRRVRDVRIAWGGVAHKPWRATLAERALRGETLEPGAARALFRAAADAELTAARPLEGNAFKTGMVRATTAAVLGALTGDGHDGDHGERAEERR